MKKEEVLAAIKGGLIVSCQALEDEPLHSAQIMGRMALAASMGGAVGIRANSVPDILEIKRHVSLPVIGIIKAHYPGSKVFITPTEKEVDALAECGAEIIATDASAGARPDGKSLDEFFATVRSRYPGQLFMADCGTTEEGLHASELGFDIVATTLSYCVDEEGNQSPDFKMIEELAAGQPRPVIAEGGIWAPRQLRQAIDSGAYAAVVGSAITRPLEITRRYVQALRAPG